MKSTTIAKTLIAIATTLAVAIAPKLRAEDGVCDETSLNGSYAFTATGTLVGLGPIAIVGRQTFDGNGAFSASQMVSLNGSTFPLPVAGAYEVKPDCTGTFSFQAFPGVTDHFFFVIDDNRKELRVIQTDPGAVVTAIARKQ